MVGDALGFAALKGVALAWGFAPLPKVFSAVDGWETFAADFTLLYRRNDGSEVKLPITPELYQRVPGPYNRRNVYGAALSYAPRLPAELVESVYCYGLGRDGSLHQALGVPPEATDVRILLRSRTEGSIETFTIAAPCNG